MGPEALFRFRIVSVVESLESQGHARTEAVRLVADQTHDGRQVSERTIWRWLKAYHEEGVEGLEPESRSPIAGSRVLSDDFIDFLACERENDRDASIPELIRRARQTGVIGPDTSIDRTTVWRTMRRLGIETRRRQRPTDQDTRRFQYPHRMQMVLLDFVHFRAGADPALRRCAVYVLDDATRKILAGRVATSETAECVLRTLADVLGRFGKMDRVFCDRGPGFVADDVAGPLATLNIALIHGRARYPQGHGKIEAFNRSTKARLLRGLRRPEIDPDLGALSLRVKHDAFEVYNHLDHESLGGDSPDTRWSSDSRELRPIAQDEVQKAFTLTESRQVSRDHIIQFAGKLWEAPRGLAGESVDVHRRLLEDNRLYIDHLGERVRLHRADLVHNATARRSSSTGEDSTDEEDGLAPKNASTMGFDKALKPMTGADGGYPASSPAQKEGDDDRKH